VQLVGGAGAGADEVVAALGEHRDDGGRVFGRHRVQHVGIACGPGGGECVDGISFALTATA
jgi:hypothetical protein